MAPEGIDDGGREDAGGAEEKLGPTVTQGLGAAAAINFDIMHEASSARGERRERRQGEVRGEIVRR